MLSQRAPCPSLMCSPIIAQVQAQHIIAQSLPPPSIQSTGFVHNPPTSPQSSPPKYGRGPQLGLHLGKPLTSWIPCTDSQPASVALTSPLAGCSCPTKFWDALPCPHLLARIATALWWPQGKWSRAAEWEHDKHIGIPQNDIHTGGGGEKETSTHIHPAHQLCRAQDVQDSGSPVQASDAECVSSTLPVVWSGRFDLHPVVCCCYAHHDVYIPLPRSYIFLYALPTPWNKKQNLHLFPMHCCECTACFES